MKEIKHIILYLVPVTTVPTVTVPVPVPVPQRWKYDRIQIYLRHWTLPVWPPGT
jgi:hypothetical protein